MKQKSKSFTCPHCQSTNVIHHIYHQKSTACRIILAIFNAILLTLAVIIVVHDISSLQSGPILVGDTIVYQYSLSDTSILKNFPLEIVNMILVLYLTIYITHICIKAQLEVFLICKDCGEHWTI